MLTIGIDLSLAKTGCVKIKNNEVVYKKLITSKPPKQKSPEVELERLMKIRDSIDITDVDLAVIEGMAYMATKTTAIMQLAGLNYMVREFLYLNNIKFVIVPPTSLKKFITGKGNCAKDLMLLETYKRYKVSFEDDNICDAFGLATIGENIKNPSNKLIKPQIEVLNTLIKQTNGSN
jgi:crossover junction endodeoxyribonuclease RuvC